MARDRIKPVWEPDPGEETIPTPETKGDDITSVGIYDAVLAKEEEGPTCYTWLYHANHGARLFTGISKSEIIQLEQQGWQDRPVK